MPEKVIDFENIKKNALNKLDKSKKGEIDERIKFLVSKINNKKDYFTTSSCSGRIVLLKKGKRKDECEWLYATHDLADADEIWQKLQQADGAINLRMEGMILHVSCRNLESVEKFLALARKIYKRAGIISLKKMSIEIISSESLEMPVIINDKLLIDKESLKLLVLETNEKMQNNWQKLEKFGKLL